jgi:hypothetical protein
MAGRYGSKSVVFLVDQFNMLAQKFQDIHHKITIETEPTGGCGDSWPEHSPTGMRSAELGFTGGFFDTSAGNSYAALKDVPADPNGITRVASVGFSGDTIGKPFIGLESNVQTEFEILGSVGKLTRANASVVVSGKSEDGVILHALTAETSAGNTEGASSVDHTTEDAMHQVSITSSSVAAASVITCPVPHGLVAGDTILIVGHSGSTPDINGEQTPTIISTTTFSIAVNVSTGGTGGTFVKAQTGGGGSAYLHCTALTLGGYTNAVIKVRHSTDDSTYVDLAAFTAITAVGAQRVTFTGPIYRHLAQSIALTGSGSGPSATYFVGVCRS